MTQLSIRSYPSPPPSARLFLPRLRPETKTNNSSLTPYKPWSFAQRAPHTPYNRNPQRPPGGKPFGGDPLRCAPRRWLRRCTTHPKRPQDAILGLHHPKSIKAIGCASTPGLCSHPSPLPAAASAAGGAPSLSSRGRAPPCRGPPRLRAGRLLSLLRHGSASLFPTAEAEGGKPGAGSFPGPGRFPSPGYARALPAAGPTRGGRGGGGGGAPEGAARRPGGRRQAGDGGR